MFHKEWHKNYYTKPPEYMTSGVSLFNVLAAHEDEGWQIISPAAQRVYAYILEEVEKSGTNCIDLPHLFAAVLRDEEVDAMQIIKQMQVDCEKLKAELAQNCTTGGRSCPCCFSLEHLCYGAVCFSFDPNIRLE